MDSTKIKAILTAARRGSLSKAAAEFSYTPSALSHILADLEEELSVRLFRRTSSGVTLTDEGKQLLPYLEKVLQSEQELKQAAARLAEQGNRSLRIAAYSSISRNLLSRFLKGFKEAHPGIKLSIHVADNLEGWLESGRADIIFADNILLGQGEWHPLFTDRYCAVAPAAFPKEKNVLLHEELYQYPHIFTDDEHLNTVFDRERFRELIYFRSEDDQAVVNMVRAGMGIALLPELVLQENAEGVRVVELHPPITRTLGYACKKQELPLGAVKFLRYLKTALQDA